jgi:hypothetical protein
MTVWQAFGDFSILSEQKEKFLSQTYMTRYLRRPSKNKLNDEITFYSSKARDFNQNEMKRKSLTNGRIKDERFYIKPNQLKLDKCRITPVFCLLYLCHVVLLFGQTVQFLMRSRDKIFYYPLGQNGAHEGID